MDALLDAADAAGAGGDPAVLAAIRDQVRAAHTDHTRLRLQAGNTKAFYGETVAGEALDLRPWRGIARHEPTELVVTVRCGTPLAELEAALAAQQQWLPFEPPHFGPGATVGGMVAAGLSGPGRASAGGVRDFVLGAVLMGASGDLLHFGGQVMKNVAGYDVSRLLAGSLGVLGPILQVSLKVLPQPPAQRSLRCSLGFREALATMNAWAGQPLPVTATAWMRGVLTVRLAGARAAVEAASRRLSAEHRAQPVDDDEAASFWRGLREQTDPFFDGDAPLWRLSVPSTAPVFEFPGTQLVEWGGALRWLRTEVDAAVIRQAAATVGGSATLFRSASRTVPVFDELSAPLLQLHRRIKRELDPHGIFNPGRLVPGL